MTQLQTFARLHLGKWNKVEKSAEHCCLIFGKFHSHLFYFSFYFAFRNRRAILISLLFHVILRSYTILATPLFPPLPVNLNYFSLNFLVFFPLLALYTHILPIFPLGEEGEKGFRVVGYWKGGGEQERYWAKNENEALRGKSHKEM